MSAEEDVTWVAIQWQQDLTHPFRILRLPWTSRIPIPLVPGYKGKLLRRRTNKKEEALVLAIAASHKAAMESAYKDTHRKIDLFLSLTDQEVPGFEVQRRRNNDDQMVPDEKAEFNSLCDDFC